MKSVYQSNKPDKTLADLFAEARLFGKSHKTQMSGKKQNLMITPSLKKTKNTLVAHVISLDESETLVPIKIK
jgi:hypothetical protein